MKISRIMLVALMVVTVTLALAACSTAQSMAVELPDELVGVIGVLVMTAITAGLKLLSDWVGFDLTDKAAEIASAVAAILVLLINWALGLIPEVYDNWVAAVFAFLIILFGGNGFYGLFFRKKNR